MVELHIHRSVYPETDHGYTWVEHIQFVRDGKAISPWIPAAGCTERLGTMPGGPVKCNAWEEEKYYCGGKADRIVKSETVNTGRWHVGPVCIWQYESKS